MIGFWKRKTGLQKLLLIFIFTSLFLLGISIGYSFYIFEKTRDIVSDSFEEINRSEDKSALRTESIDPIEDNVSILFMGVDTGEERGYGNSSRSDALILATLNANKNSIKLLSIPRDTYAYIPELEYYSKINHAHFYGGAKATIETVEKLLNVPVDYYVRLNFDAFVEVINTLDGIRYDVPYEIYEMDSHDKKDAIHLKAGEQILNGEEALALARTRKYDNDIQRGQRQQEIMKAIFDRATSLSSIFKLGNVLDAIGPNMSTNLTFNQMTSFLSYVSAEHIAIETLHLEGEGGYMNDGGWYYQIDEYNKQDVTRILNEHLNLY